MSDNLSARRRSRLSNIEKRMLVRGRLATPDSAGLSDRQIARELGLSQPFVSAQRRVVRAVQSERELADDTGTPNAGPTSPPMISELAYTEVFEEYATEARPAIFTPVGLGRVGWVRRPTPWSFDDDRPGATEPNPFDFG